MGTASTTKLLQLNANGNHAETAALTTSAGAADAQRIVALNAAGQIDSSMLNAKSGSAGAADASKIVARDGSGRIAMSDMPVGIGADTATIQTSEALAAGNWVNVHDGGSGAFRVRKADATTEGKEVHGFVLAAAASGAQAEVYFEGTNTQVTGQKPGKVFLQTTAGLGGDTAPTGAGNVVQCVGIAVSATAVNFEAGIVIVRGA